MCMYTFYETLNLGFKGAGYIYSDGISSLSDPGSDPVSPKEKSPPNPSCRQTCISQSC